MKKIVSCILIILFCVAGFAEAYAADSEEYDYVTKLPTTLSNSTGGKVVIKQFNIKRFEYYPQSNKIGVHYYVECVQTGNILLQFNCYDSNGELVDSYPFDTKGNYITVPDYTSSFSVEPKSSGGKTSGQFVYRRRTIMRSSDGKKSVTVYDMQIPLYEEDGWICKDVEMYSPDGIRKMVDRDEVSRYKADGWYEYPVVVLYALDGRTIEVPPGKEKSYKAVGWYDYPPALLYASDGRSVVVEKSRVAAMEANGWFDASKVVTICASDGRSAVIPLWQLQSYEAVGWYDSTKEVTICTPDGRSAVIPLWQLESYEAVGWINGEKPVTVYGSNGISKHILYKDLYFYKKSGWSEQPLVKLYAHGKTAEVTSEQVDAYLNLGWSLTYVGDHNWKAATCSSPAICSVCGLKVGSLGAHKYSKSTGKCTTCGLQYLLYSKNGISIYFKGISSYNRGSWDNHLYINFEIVNKSKQAICVQTRNEAINGYMSDFIMSTDVTVGNRALTYACLYKSYFADVCITNYYQANEFQFSFIITRMNSVTVIDNSPIYTLNFR